MFDVYKVGAVLAYWSVHLHPKTVVRGKSISEASSCVPTSAALGSTSLTQMGAKTVVQSASMREDYLFLLVRLWDGHRVIKKMGTK